MVQEMDQADDKELDKQTLRGTIAMMTIDNQDVNSKNHNNQQQQQQYQQGIVHKISNATFVNYKKTKFLLSTNKSGYNQINNEYVNDTIDEEDIGVVNVMNEMSTSTSLSSIQTQTTRISSPDLHFPIPTVDMIDSDLSDDDNNDKISSAFRSNKRTPDSTSQYLINERKEGLKQKG